MGGEINEGGVPLCITIILTPSDSYLMMSSPWANHFRRFLSVDRYEIVKKNRVENDMLAWRALCKYSAMLGATALKNPRHKKNTVKP